MLAIRIDRKDYTMPLRIKAVDVTVAVPILLLIFTTTIVL